MSHQDPPFKMAGPGGIYLGGQPRWLILLIDYAAILYSGVQLRLTRMPPPGQVEPPFQLPRRLICLKSTWGVEQTVSTRWILISVARSRPGGPRWLFQRAHLVESTWSKKVIEHGLSRSNRAKVKRKWHVISKRFIC